MYIKYPKRFAIITAISILLGLIMSIIMSRYDLSFSRILIIAIISGIIFSILIVSLVWLIVKEDDTIINKKITEEK